jgi:chromosome partitioning protein
MGVMRIIGVCGRKGGSGKTTTAVNVASELASRGLRTALVDCDSQASATLWAAPGNLPVPVHPMPLESDDDVEKWSSAVWALNADYVVIDSPPHLSATLGAVIAISHVVLIPCGPSGMELIGAAETVGLVREIHNGREKGGPSVLLLPTRVDRRTAAGRELPEALAELNEVVAPEQDLRMVYSDAFNDGTWVGAHARKSTAYKSVRKLTDTVIRSLESVYA